MHSGRQAGTAGTYHLKRTSKRRCCACLAGLKALYLQALRIPPVWNSFIFFLTPPPIAPHQPLQSVAFHCRQPYLLLQQNVYVELPSNCPLQFHLGRRRQADGEDADVPVVWHQRDPVLHRQRRQLTGSRGESTTGSARGGGAWAGNPSVPLLRGPLPPPPPRLPLPPACGRPPPRGRRKRRWRRRVGPQAPQPALRRRHRRGRGAPGGSPPQCPRKGGRRGKGGTAGAGSA